MLLVFHCCGYTWAIVNSQVSVYRTIGPTLVSYCVRVRVCVFVFVLIVFVLFFSSYNLKGILKILIMQQKSTLK